MTSVSCGFSSGLAASGGSTFGAGFSTTGRTVWADRTVTQPLPKTVIKRTVVTASIIFFMASSPYFRPVKDLLSKHYMIAHF
ncbi:MAG: hypothetical protein AAB568_00910 [Patescibacteria group bacterium]